MNQIVFAIIFSAFSIGTRLVDHAPNFAAIGALALWAGIYLPRKYSLALPVVVMFVSDSIVGFYDTSAGFLKIDDMDSVSLRENETGHLWIPSFGLMTKVYT